MSCRRGCATRTRPSNRQRPQSWTGSTAASSRWQTTARGPCPSIPRSCTAAERRRGPSRPGSGTRRRRRGMPEVRVLTEGLQFPEGPVVLPDGSVAVCEIQGQRLTRVDQDGNKETIAETGGGPNGAQLGPDGKLYVCNNGAAYDFVDMGGLTITHQPPSSHEGGRIERVDIESGEVEVLYTEANGNDFNAPNDLVFDEHGGFWFTDHGIRYDPSTDRTYICYAQADGSEVREVMGPMDGPNGIGLSPDGTKLYVAETYNAAIWSWDLTAPGEIGEGMPLLPHHGTPVARVNG